MKSSFASCTSAAWTSMESNGEHAVHSGVVTAVSGENATVRFTRGSMCAHCGACMRAGDDAMELTLPNTLGARIGDSVEVSLSSRKIVKASLIAYLIPLGFLLLGIWLGSRVSDVVALFGGLVGWAVSFIVLRIIDKRLRGGMEFRLAMTSFASEQEIRKTEN